MLIKDIIMCCIAHGLWTFSKQSDASLEISDVSMSGSKGHCYWLCAALLGSLNVGPSKLVSCCSCFEIKC